MITLSYTVRSTQRTKGGVAHVHFHLAIKGKLFMLLPVKRALLQRHGFASHWSDTHSGYWSAVRYGCWPSPTKPQATLDLAPLKWARLGEHPHLAEAAQEPITANALGRRREKAAMDAAESGVREPKPSEVDVWPLVVKHKISNTSENHSGHLRLMKIAKECCTPQMFKFLFSIRSKLPSLIDDIWTWEEIDDRLAKSEQTRGGALADAMLKDCCCAGEWPKHASASLHANGIDAVELGHDIYHALHAGRSESTPVVVLAGKQGGEGKSLALYPLPAVIGQSYVQSSPAKGSLPLLGIEHKKVRKSELII